MHNTLDILTTGGPVVLILAGFSIIGLSIFFLKLVQHWGLRSIYNKNLDQAIDHIVKHDPAQARLLLGQQTSPRHCLIHTAIELISSPQWHSRELREELRRIARRTVEQSGHYLRILEVITVTAPLLGLFGTVLGMIEAFKAMEMAGSQVNPAVLSGGIWKALLTTAVGLAVAIPASLGNSWLERRTETIATLFEDDIGRLVKANHNAQPQKLHQQEHARNI